jgi:hypothetical protein
LGPLERVREAASRVAASYGLDIFDVDLRREGGQQVLRVVLDRPGPNATAEDSVSLEDCARVSEELSAILDVEDVIPAYRYTLEVRHLDWTPAAAALTTAGSPGGRPRSCCRSRLGGRPRLRAAFSVSTATT